MPVEQPDRNVDGDGVVQHQIALAALPEAQRGDIGRLVIFRRLLDPALRADQRLLIGGEAPAGEIGRGGDPDERLHPLRPCARRSEEHTSELQSLMRISYAVFCLKKKKTKKIIIYPPQHTYH